jgi:hypothetical protein
MVAGTAARRRATARVRRQGRAARGKREKGRETGRRASSPPREAPGVHVRRRGAVKRRRGGGLRCAAKAAALEL